MSATVAEANSRIWQPTQYFRTESVFVITLSECISEDMRRFKVGLVSASDRIIFNGSVPIGGYEYELLKILAQALNFEPEIFVPEFDKWGKMQADGNWTGLIGMVSRKEVDFGIGSLEDTSSKREIADFSFPYTLDAYTFTIRKPRILPTYFNTIKPFQLTVWLGIVGAFMVCCGFLTLMTQFPFSTRGHKKRQLKWDIIDVAENLLSNQDLPKNSTATRTRILKLVWNIFKLVLMYSYVGLLLSFLMTPLRERQIKTIEELAEASQTGKVKVSTYIYATIVSQLKEAKDYPYWQLSKYLRDNPDGLFRKNIEVEQFLLDGGAILGSASALSEWFSKAGYEDQVSLSSSALRLRPSNIMFSKDFRYIREFDKKIHCIWQSGIFDKIKDHQMFRLLLKTRKIKAEEFRPINFSDISGILIIVFSLYVLSFVVLLIERYVHKRSVASKRKKVSLKS